MEAPAVLHHRRCGGDVMAVRELAVTTGRELRRREPLFTAHGARCAGCPPGGAALGFGPRIRQGSEGGGRPTRVPFFERLVCYIELALRLADAAPVRWSPPDAMRASLFR